MSTFGYKGKGEVGQNGRNSVYVVCTQILILPALYIFTNFRLYCCAPYSEFTVFTKVYSSSEMKYSSDV